MKNCIKVFIVTIVSFFVSFIVANAATFTMAECSEGNYIRAAVGSNVKLTDVDHQTIILPTNHKVEILQEINGWYKIYTNYYSNNYTGYIKEDKQSSCECNIKNKMDTITEIIENPNKLSDNFDNEDSDSSSGSSNIISIKCTKALFSKDGLKKNISSYILLFFIAYFLFSITLFIKCGYPPILM